MSAWAEFVRNYAAANGMKYSEAASLPEVKEAYKIKKMEAVVEQNAILLEKLDAEIEEFEAEKALVEQPEDSTVTVTYEQAENDWREAVRNKAEAEPEPDIVIVTIEPPAINNVEAPTPKLFCSKQRRGGK